MGGVVGVGEFDVVVLVVCGVCVDVYDAVEAAFDGVFAVGEGDGGGSFVCFLVGCLCFV